MGVDLVGVDLVGVDLVGVDLKGRYRNALITIHTMAIVLIPCATSSHMILLSSVSFFKCRANKFYTFASFNAFLLCLLPTSLVPFLPAIHPKKAVRVLVAWQPFLIFRLLNTSLTLATQFLQHKVTPSEKPSQNLNTSKF